MARFSAGGLTGAGSTTLPIIGIYAGATGSPRLVGMRVWNTTAVPVEFELVRLTTAGTWTATTEAPWYDRSNPSTAQIVITATGTAPTVGTRLGMFYILGGAIGSGIMDTFDEGGFSVPTGVANGIGLIPMGTGAACRATFIYEDE